MNRKTCFALLLNFHRIIKKLGAVGSGKNSLEPALGRGNLGVGVCARLLHVEGDCEERKLRSSVSELLWNSNGGRDFCFWEGWCVGAKIVTEVIRATDWQACINTKQRFVPNIIRSVATSLSGFWGQKEAANDE